MRSTAEGASISCWMNARLPAFVLTGTGAAGAGWPDPDPDPDPVPVVGTAAVNADRKVLM